MTTYEVTRTTTETISIQAENEREAISIASRTGAGWSSADEEYLADGRYANYCEHGTPSFRRCVKCSE